MRVALHTLIVAALLATPVALSAATTIVRGETSFEPGRLILEFDLPSGGPYDVELVVDLGGRMPMLTHPSTTEGDVGEEIRGGRRGRIEWRALDERRWLHGTEEAWVLITDNSPEIVEGPVPGLVFSVVPAGAFRMGAPAGETSRRNEEGPVRQRQLDAFEMSTTEVRQAAYEAVVGENPSKMKGPHRPVERVTFAEAVAFCRQLTASDPAYAYRLPTEAEWEYACRSGTESAYYWDGEGIAEPEGRVAMRTLGWCTENAGMRTRDVGDMSSNAWGFFDMHGNVAEWCLDEYGKGLPAEGPDADSLWAEITVALDASGDEPPEPVERAVRGGSWKSPATKCRSASRDGVREDKDKTTVGFRVVRTPR